MFILRPEWKRNGLKSQKLVKEVGRETECVSCSSDYRYEECISLFGL